MSINYTVIIPHKNAPDLLLRCLDSIPRREDFQIIVVDDNSSQDKVDFNHFPGINDPCVEVVFTKSGKGAGAARNIGLSRAKGKWLLFADSDDFFNNCFLESVDNYCSSDADIVYFSLTSVCSDSIEKEGNRDKQFVEMIEEALVTNNFDKLRYNHFIPSSKMIKRELILKHNILFDETMANNDAMFSVLTGHYAGKVIADLSPIYCLTFSIGSISRSYSNKIAFDRLYVNQRINKLLRKAGKGKYTLNLIPYIVCVNHLVFTDFISRLALLSVDYFLFYVWADLFKSIEIGFRKTKKG